MSWVGKLVKCSLSCSSCGNGRPFPIQARGRVVMQRPMGVLLLVDVVFGKPPCEHVGSYWEGLSDDMIAEVDAVTLLGELAG